MAIFLPVVAMHDYIPAVYMKHVLCNCRLLLASAGYDAQSRHRSLGKALEIDHNCLVSPLIERQSSMATHLSVHVSVVSTVMIRCTFHCSRVFPLYIRM